MTYRKKKRLILILILIIAAAAVVIVAVAVTKLSGDKGTEAELSEIADQTAQAVPAKNYEMDLSIYESENSFSISFDSDEQTFSAEMNGEVLSEGTYEVAGNLITITSGEDETSQLNYLLDGEYLLLEAGMYQGTIPEGEYFEAKVSQTDSTGMKITYTFKEDGTYTCTENTDDGETVLEGTYQREGNLITRTLSGNEMIPFYIYEDHIFASYYTEAEDED